MQKMGGGDFKYVCRIDGLDVEVGIDYGGGYAQLRYHVIPAQLRGRGASGWLTLERSLGLGFGDWDRITADNLAASMDALCDCVRYAATLPVRRRRGSLLPANLYLDLAKRMHPAASTSGSSGVTTRV